MGGRKSRQTLYQFVDALVETGTRRLVERPIDGPDDARERMREIAHDICSQYARSVLYVPLDLEFVLAKRDRAMWEQYGVDGPDGARKFSPRRVAQLAEEHRVTTVQVYAILRLMRQREIEGRKGRLPGIEAAEEVIS